MFNPAYRMQTVAEAVFYELIDIANERRIAGKSVIDLGIGSPDMPPPKLLQETLKTALDQPGIYGYQRTEGIEQFKSAIAEFLDRRYQVRVSPENEVLVTIGAQDALAHLALAFINPGDVVLLPDPGYPIYEVSVQLAGGIPYLMPLIKENNFLPDLDNIPADILKKAKMIIVNYPSNPTTAVAPPEFFAQLVTFAQRNHILVVHDAAYIELVFDGYTAPAFLQVPGAKEVGIELFSFSKTFNFAGPRLAFAAGNQQILKILAKLKSQIDYGVFTAIQIAGAHSLTHEVDFIEQNRQEYQNRRDALLAPLMDAGWPVIKPLGTMFVWLKTPKHMQSDIFSKQLLKSTGIISVPGKGFGKHGEGYVRLALIQPTNIMHQVGNTISKQFPL